MPKRSLGTKWLLACAAVLGLVASGCADKAKRAGTSEPEARTVIAEPSTYEGVYVDGSYYEKSATGAPAEAVGYETLSSGDVVHVVVYDHTYPEPLETYPRVYWSGRWYYNVNGDFVFWSPEYGAWTYYWGPPAPLVAYWNVYYPWCPYYWGVGFYGAGWYWGGVGYYGYHAYGLPVVHQNHHHHGDHDGGRRPGTDGRRPSPGGPTGQPGGPGRKPDPSAGGPGKPEPPRRKPAPPRRTVPTDGKGKGKGNTPTRATGGTKLANTGGAPKRTVPARRTTPKPKPTRSYVTAGGQKVTVIDPPGRRAPPARKSRLVGRTSPAAARSPARRTQPSAVPAFGGDSSGPRWGATHAPSSAGSAPKASAPPGWGTGPSRSAPSRSAPSRSAPSRSYSPSRSSPSRSRSPSRSPSRSSPSRSRSPSRTYSPSRSSPSRSRSPSRSPSRSSPSRSRSPSRSSPSRSRSPSRSSPSRSAPRRSSGGRKR